MMKNGCSLWLTYVTFLNYFNKLNLQMQGRNTNIIKFVNALKAFTAKLSNWKRKIPLRNYSMFEKLDILLDNRENKLPVQIENDIVKHLLTLEKEFESFFPENTNDKLDFVRNPFTLSVKNLSDEYQDEI